MSLPFFVCDDPRTGVLVGPEAQHAHVKRIAVGEQIMLTDGNGLTTTVTVTHTAKNELRGDVVAQHVVQAPSPRVTVVQAIPKSERSELAVDLAVQAGADAIIPWISHRTIARWPENKQAKMVEKWQNQALASAKQARRAWVPQVAAPVSSGWLGGVDKQKLILHEDATTSIRDVELADDIYLVVGPEGGIGADELELIGGTPVKLGPEVLRTASAAFAGLCAIGTLTKRW